MLETFVSYFADRNVAQLARDALDVFIVYYIFYRALLVVRGTRAIQVGVGLGAVMLLYVVAQRLRLETVLNILGTLLSSMLLLVVVVFQNDIRRGLMRLGRGASLGGSRTAESQVIDDVVEAATELAKHRIGAIICFEKEANLDEFVEQSQKGISLDAQVTRELLVSLFLPEGLNKLHDGAVIIRSLRIAKAGVFFPMSGTRAMDSQFGSRHRAAMAITEETDAVLVVVSEERGTISFCFNGNIVSPISAADLRSMLNAELGPRKKATKVAAKAVLARAAAPKSAADRSSRVTLASPPEESERTSKLLVERTSRSEDRKTAIPTADDSGPISIRFTEPTDARQPGAAPADETPKPLRQRKAEPTEAEPEARPTSDAPKPLRQLKPESIEVEPEVRPTGTPLAPATTPMPLRSSSADGPESSRGEPGEGT